jgi:hypothetical protein
MAMRFGGQYGVEMGNKNTPDVIFISDYRRHDFISQNRRLKVASDYL